MCEVINEAEGISFTSCNDFYARDYLLYQPVYPWQLSKTDLNVTQEKLDEIFNKYVSIVTDDPICPEYLAPENGG